MKTYIIDYEMPNGRKDFCCVLANSPNDAVRIMRSKGLNGWTGYDFADYKILNVAER